MSNREIHLPANLYPCLWFQSNAAEAVNYYNTVFRNSAIYSSGEMACSFQLMDTRFIAINGNRENGFNPAVSFFVYCGSENEIERLYDLLRQDGNVLMPLGAYPWASKYAWVSDKYGINWQLDIDDIKTKHKIVPALMFANHKAASVKLAVEHYTGIIPQSRILLESPFGPDAGMPEDAVLFAQIKLNQFVLNCMASPVEHHFDFNPAVSFVIECSGQDDIDYYWDELGKNGTYQMCGWLTDQFGVSWQIIPDRLPELLSSPGNAGKLFPVMTQMRKINISDMESALSR